MTHLLQQLADNQALFDEAKKTLLKQFDFGNLDNQNTNEVLGQVVRARLDGILLVEQGFREIAKYKTLKVVPTMDNPAR